MQIKCQKLGSDKTFVVKVESDGTIRDLRKAIHATIGTNCPIDQLTLLIGGQPLQDTVTLAQAQLTEQSLVTVEAFGETKTATIIQHWPRLQSKTINMSLNVKQSAKVARTDRTNNSEPAEPTGNDLFELYNFVSGKFDRLCQRSTVCPMVSPTAFTWSFTFPQIRDIDTMIEMGFRSSIIVQVYVACDRDLQSAINVLLQDGT